MCRDYISLQHPKRVLGMGYNLVESVCLDVLVQNEWFLILHFKKYFICVLCVCTCVCMHATAHMWRSEETQWNELFPSPSEFQGWSLVHHLAREPSPAEPSRQPYSRVTAKSVSPGGAVHQPTPSGQNRTEVEAALTVQGPHAYSIIFSRVPETVPLLFQK